MAGYSAKIIMRLNKFLSTYSNVSRRQADKLIFDGKVKVNGKIVDTPAYQVDEINDKVYLKGSLVGLSEEIYVKFYKPVKCLTAYGDGRGRLNLNDFLLLKEYRLPYSGRLDYDSEGLILFTNNGDLIYKLQKPEFKVSKEYIVKVNKELTYTQMKTFSNGLLVEGMNYGKCKIEKTANKTYNVTLFEGKKRQIRKMFEFFDLRVVELKRVRIGPVKLSDMDVGEIRYLSKSEIKELKKCIE
jgi:23S rRNA pseudouridine2605 synthase/23S rRNA pseudouridine2604 synthase